MTVADRIGVMDHGRLVQVATPPEIYEQPNSRWVADFIGDVNLIEGSVVEADRPRRRSRARAPDAARDAGRRRQAGRHRMGRAAAGEGAHRARAAGRRQARTASPAQVMDIGYLGDLSIYKVRARQRLRDEGGGRQHDAADRAADRLGRPGLADLGAGGGRGADEMSTAMRWRTAMSRAIDNGRSWGARLVVLIPYLWLAAVLPRAVPDRAEDQPVADRDRAAALCAGVRSRRRLARR